MRNLAIHTSAVLGKLVSFRKLHHYNYPIFLPYYHVVSNNTLPHVQNYPYRNIKEFEKELDFILKYFKPISIDDLITRRFTGKKVFHLSFDDGLKECAEVIAPILYRKGIPATFFINPAFIDNKELFHRYKGSLLLGKLLRDKIDVKQFLADNNFDGENLLKVKYSQKAVLDNLATKVDLSFTDFLKMQKPYLTMHQLSGLQNKGFSIGAHSWDHPEFWLISEEEQISQIRNSVDWVKDKMNPKHLVFSFPYTDDQCSVELFERMRNENIYNLSFGTAGIKYDEFPTHLQRFPCETKFPLPQQLKTELVYSYLRKFAGKHVVKHNAKN